MKALLGVVGFCLLSHQLLANGGGYMHGGVDRTGTIVGFEPEGTEKVHILDEQLDVRLARECAHVEVKYVLKNTSDRKAVVRFGFPVEEVKSRDLFMVKTARDHKPEQASAPKYCRDYQVEIGGKAVIVDFTPETGDPKADPWLAGLKGWLVSKTSFGPSEEKMMTIRYLADYSYSEQSISEDEESSARIFRYRLSTGACWQGPIERGAIRIRAEGGVELRDIRILEPVNRFHKVEDRWEWTFEKLEPTLADDISAEAVPAEASYDRGWVKGESIGKEGKRVRVTKRGDTWYASHMNYSVKASSTLKPQGEHRYDAKNIASSEELYIGQEEWWSEGAPGNGVGKWLEFTPEVARPLRSIEILPGHPGSKEFFEANTRPKRVEVLLNGERRFDAVLKDELRWQTIMIRDYEQPVKRLRLTFKEVYPGSKYEDLCVTRIMLETRLNKEPKIQPAR